MSTTMTHMNGDVMDHADRKTSKSKLSNVRLYRLLDLILPVAIIAFILNGWYLSLVGVGIRFLTQRNGSVWFGSLYIFSTGTLFGTLIALTLYIVSTRFSGGTDHSDPSDSSLLTEPYECVNAQGDLRRCAKSGCPCYEKWKPPRTHHCSTCGVCRTGFDHHCPWLGTCIRTSNLPAFLLILIITPILFLLAVSPIMPILPVRIAQGFTVSRETPWIRERWWDRWYSWIFIGGPPGRYVVGALLGLRELQDDEARGHDNELRGTIIAEQGVELLLVVFFAILLSVSASIMTFAMVRDITLGQTTLDTIARKRAPGSGRSGVPSLLCIPETSSSDERKVYKVLSEERLYDLGWRENWRKLSFQVQRNGIFAKDERFSWPKINPAILRRCRDAVPELNTGTPLQRPLGSII